MDASVRQNKKELDGSFYRNETNETCQIKGNVGVVTRTGVELYLLQDCAVYIS